MRSSVVLYLGFTLYRERFKGSHLCLSTVMLMTGGRGKLESNLSPLGDSLPNQERAKKNIC